MLALQALSDGAGRTASFGFSDADAHAAGLACGGAIDVVAYPLSIDDAVAVEALEAVLRDEAVAVGLVIAGGADGAGDPPNPVGRVLPISADRPDDSILTLSYAPRPRLVILGAGDYAAALSKAAAVAGFAVTVCDGWGMLVTPERFPDAEQLIVQLPDEYLRETAAAPRPAHRDLRPHPRRAPGRPGAAGSTSAARRIRRRRGRPTHRRPARRAAARAGRDRGTAGSPAFAARTGSRSRESAGDGDLDPRRDHLGPSRRIGGGSAGCGHAHSRDCAPSRCRGVCDGGGRRAILLPRSVVRTPSMTAGLLDRGGRSVTARIVVEGGYVATVDSAGTEHATGHVVLEDGRIAAVGAGPAPAALREGAEVVDATGCLVTPGLVNTHHHLYQWLTRGYAQDAILFDWLTALYPLWARIDARLTGRRRGRRDGRARPLRVHHRGRPPLRLPAGLGRHRRRDRRGRPAHRRSAARDARVDGPGRLAGRPAARLRRGDDGCRPRRVSGVGRALSRRLVRLDGPGRRSPPARRSR